MIIRLKSLRKIICDKTFFKQFLSFLNITDKLSFSFLLPLLCEKYFLYLNFLWALLKTPTSALRSIDKMFTYISKQS